MEALEKTTKRKATDAEETTQEAKRAKREVENETADGDATTSSNGEDNRTATSLSDLPVDVLIKIVSMLPRAQWASLEEVNRQLQRAAFGAWRSVRKVRLDEDFVFKRSVLEGNTTIALECLLEKLLLRSPNINEMTGFAFVGDIKAQRRDQCFCLLGQFRSLERVSFANWQVLRYDIVGLLTQLRRLGNIKELDISGMGIDRSRKVLDIGNDSLKLDKLWFRDASAESLHVDNVSLTALSVAGTWIDPDSVLALVNTSDRLERLEFSVCVGLLGLRQVLIYKELFRAVIALASKNLSVLRLGFLDISYWRGLHSEFVHLLEECGRYRRLKELSVFNWDSTTEVVDTIANNLPDLTSLEIKITNDCGAASLVNLFTKLTQLQKLKFACYYTRTRPLEGSVVSALATNLIDLKSLDLDCTFLPPTNLEDLAALANLKKMCIRAECVDSRVLTAWSDGFGSNLGSLSLVGRPRKGYLRGLSLLLKKASGLRLLDLDHAGVTDVHLRIIASSCPLLREFYIWCKKGFTVEGVQAVIDGCRQLKWLQIQQRLYTFDRMQLNVGKYRKINFCKRDKKTPFGGDE